MHGYYQKTSGSWRKRILVFSLDVSPSTHIDVVYTVTFYLYNSQPVTGQLLTLVYQNPRQPSTSGILVLSAKSFKRSNRCTLPSAELNSASSPLWTANAGRCKGTFTLRHLIFPNNFCIVGSSSSQESASPHSCNRRRFSSSSTYSGLLYSGSADLLDSTSLSSSFHSFFLPIFFLKFFFFSNLFSQISFGGDPRHAVLALALAPTIADYWILSYFSDTVILL